MPIILGGARRKIVSRWKKGTPPPAIDNILLENGDNLLLEDGSLIVLEA